MTKDSEMSSGALATTDRHPGAARSASGVLRSAGCALATLAAFHRLTPESRRENTLANFRVEIALQHYLVKLGVVGAQERLDRIGEEFLGYGMHEGRAAIERAGTYSMRKES